MLTARFSLLGLLALSLLSNASQSETVLKGRSYQPGDAILRCGTLIDGLSESPLLDQTVTIRAGRITSVQPTAEFIHNDNESETTDLSDFTCLPGLINTHVHFDGNPGLTFQTGLVDLTEACSGDGSVGKFGEQLLGRRPQFLFDAR